MKALTLRQPWAWAVMHGGKDVENRTRNIVGSYRGPVAITAAKRVSKNAVGMFPPDIRIGAIDWTTLAVLGVVDLVDVLPPEYIEHAEANDAWCSEWAIPGHFQLCLENPRPLPTPIPVRGRLGLWTLPDDISAQVEEALR